MQCYPNYLYCRQLHEVMNHTQKGSKNVSYWSNQYYIIKPELGDRVLYSGLTTVTIYTLFITKVA